MPASLEHQKRVLAHLEEQKTKDMDREATDFALELLMPEKMLRADLAKMGGIDLADHRAVDRLAKRYRVDPAVLALRIGQLMGRT